MRLPATTNRTTLLKMLRTAFAWVVVFWVNALTRCSNWLNITDVSERRKPEANRTYLNVIGRKRIEWCQRRLCRWLVIVRQGQCFRNRQIFEAVIFHNEYTLIVFMTTYSHHHTYGDERSVLRAGQVNLWIYRWQSDWFRDFHRGRFSVFLLRELIYPLDRCIVVVVVVNWNNSNVKISEQCFERQGHSLSRLVYLSG